MNSDTLRLILQVGGGMFSILTANLIIFLLRRRAELRQLDTQSDATISTSYKDLVETLRAEAKRHQDQVKELQARVDLVETRADKEQRQFTAQLNDAHTENTRLATRVAQLQTDLDICSRQVTDLQYRLRGP